MAKTSQKERDKVKVWRARIEEGKEAMKPHLKDSEENLQFLLGMQWDDIEEPTDEDQIVINKFFSIVREMVPGLAFTSSKYYITAERPELVTVTTGQDEQGNPIKEEIDVSDDRARSKGIWVNSKFKKTNGILQLRLSIISALLGLGVARTGFRPLQRDNIARGVFETTGEGEDAAYTMVVDKKTGDNVPKLEQGDYLRDSEGVIQYEDDETTPRLDPGREIIHGDYQCKWVPTKNMVFDPNGMNDLNDHDWVAEEFEDPFLDVIEDPSLKNRRRIRATHETVVEKGGKKKKGASPGKRAAARRATAAATDAISMDRKKVRGWIIYNMRDREILVILDTPMDRNKDSNHDFFAREDKIEPGGQLHPYSTLKFFEIPGRFWPQPHMSPLKPIQRMINETRARWLQQMRVSDRKFTYSEGTFATGTEGLEAFTSGGDMAGAKVNQGQQPRWMEAPRTDSVTATVAQAAELDLREGSSVSAERLGIANSETATAANLINEGDELRTSDNKSAVVDFAADIGTKLLTAGAENMTETEWVAIAGPNKKNPWEFRGEIKPADLQGEAMVKVELGSMQPETTPIKRAQWIQFWGFIAPIVQQGSQLLTSEWWIRKTLRLFEIEDDEAVQELKRIGFASLEQLGAGKNADQTPDSPIASRPGQPGSGLPVVPVEIQ